MWGSQAVLFLSSQGDSTNGWGWQRRKAERPLSCRNHLLFFKNHHHYFWEMVKKYVFFILKRCSNRKSMLLSPTAWAGRHWAFDMAESSFQVSESDAGIQILTPRLPADMTLDSASFQPPHWSLPCFRERVPGPQREELSSPWHRPYAQDASFGVVLLPLTSS